MSGLDRYFARIGYRGERTATLATLQALHQCHAESIAFENLSPFAGHEVALDSASLHGKLLQAGRGGYCFEQNLLLLEMLREIGFDAHGLAARVSWQVPDGRILPRTHMLLLVRLPDGPYIADVGFGGLTLTAPLRLEVGREQITPHETFRLLAQGEGFALQAFVGGDWQTLYGFDLQEQHLADYELTSWYLSHHPQSRFVGNLIAARPAPGCRHALSNTRYTVRHLDGTSEQRSLRTADEMFDVLENVFGLHARQIDGLLSRVQRLIAADDYLRL